MMARLKADVSPKWHLSITRDPLHQLLLQSGNYTTVLPITM